MRLGGGDRSNGRQSVAVHSTIVCAGDVLGVMEMHILVSGSAHAVKVWDFESQSFHLKQHCTAQLICVRFE